MIIDEKWLLELLDSPLETQILAGEDKEAMLIRGVTHLIETDFAGLCQLLYRVDVDEKRLKERLNSSDAPPAEIIAHLLLERQKQKVALRAKYQMGIPKDIPEDERW